jgi:hypothetical protein
MVWTRFVGLVGAVITVATAGPFPVAAQSPTGTTVLGPFTGVGAPLHPRNERPHRIAYYGTDLGFSYEHGGKIHFLFGDTLANERGDVIEASTGTTFDDGFGTVDLGQWPDARGIGAGRLPLIELGQNAGTTEMSALDPGQALESFKTPLGGFSNGAREFALFYSSKPRGCRVDAECANGLACDNGLGFSGERYDKADGFTLACIDGTPGCTDDTIVDRAGGPVKGSGFCSDRTSSVWAQSNVGRASAVATTQLFRVRGLRDPRRYEGVPEWLTNKFANVTLRPVADFDPAKGAGRRNQDYRNRDAAGPNRRVFLWGRPGFIGVGTKGRSLGLYFAYVDMPLDAPVSWNVRYFSGTDASGIPRFSASERDALALDLDAGQHGRQPAEPHDIVNQMSIVWVESLGKWLMLYGGGTTSLPSPPLLNRCGILEFFTREECKDVRVGNGAIRMRTADDPWGPWSAPQDVIVGGDPNASPPRDQYAVGGMLRHPACTASGCAPHMNSPNMQQAEYGFLYGVNIVEPWVTATPEAVEVIWNASTWDPYRVILLKTRIARR